MSFLDQSQSDIKQNQFNPGFLSTLLYSYTVFRLLSYPDNNHPISKVEAESDSFINMARWFFEHLLK